MTRRSLFASLAAAAFADPDKLLWTPRKKLISIPKRLHLPETHIICVEEPEPGAQDADVIRAFQQHIRKWDRPVRFLEPPATIPDTGVLGIRGRIGRLGPFPGVRELHGYDVYRRMQVVRYELYVRG